MSQERLEEVRRVKREVEGELLAIEGVVGVDVGRKIVAGVKTDVLAIRVYVENKEDLVEALQSQICGVPVEVIERRFVLHSDSEPSPSDG